MMAGVEAAGAPITQEVAQETIPAPESLVPTGGEGFQTQEP